MSGGSAAPVGDHSGAAAAPAKDDKKDDKKDKKDAAADYQLSRALDLIRALSIYQRTTDTSVDAAAPAAAPTPVTNKK